MTHTHRFPISFDPAYALLSKVLFLSPSDSYVDVGERQVSVRMAWGFRATFDKTAVARATPSDRHVPLTRGVHGFGGRWLVNGSGDGILTIDLASKQRAYVMGFPVKLTQLAVSVEDPQAVAKALSPASPAS